MANFPIDIPLPQAVKDKLKQLDCDQAIRLPQPQKAPLCLPFGGQMQGFVDPSKAHPDDCSLTFSLLAQLSPLLASLGCFVKVLKLLKPLIDIIGGLTNPADAGKIAAAIPDFTQAASDIAGCFLALTGGVPLFIRDVLLTIARLLKCVAGQLSSAAALMNGVTLKIQTAEVAGNQAMLRSLNCAKDNALTQANAAIGSMDMIAAVMSLLEPLLSLAPGVPSLSLPTIGNAQDAFEVEQAAHTMLSLATSLEQIAKVLPTKAC
jgi:hypothetical protein